MVDILLRWMMDNIFIRTDPAIKRENQLKELMELWLPLAPQRWIRKFFMTVELLFV